jgi:phage terminase small subunit
MALNDKQKLFIEHYLSCLNATEAARRAGYSPKTAYSIGSENLTKPEIRAEIDRRVADVAMSADEVLRRLADHARGTLEDFIRFTKNGDTIDLAEAQKAGKLHLLKKYRVDKDGGVTIELHDPQAALLQLGRYHGLFLDKTAFTDPTGKLPVPVIYLPAVDVAKGDGGAND